MKKVLSVILSLILLCSAFTFSVTAAQDIIAEASATAVPVESTVTITVSLPEGTKINADKIAISVAHSNTYFQYMGGKFLQLEGSMSTDTNTANAEIIYGKAVTLSGALFEFTLKATSLHTDERTVKITLNATQNGSTTYSSALDTKVRIVCANHLYSNWDTITAADCENDGERQRTCYTCNYVETEVVKAYGHNFSDMEILREATCTEKGYERGFCSRCMEKLLNEIEPLGHTIGEFAVAEESTCTENGTEQAKCSKCDYVESREIEKLGHEFLDPVITTEPTLGKHGIETGYCSRCNETTEGEVSCGYNDKETGIVLIAEDDAYPENTKATITVLEKGSGFNFTAKSLAHITNRFKAFLIDATSRGFRVDPEGETTIIFPIPEEYGAEAIIYYINDDGDVKKLSAEFNEDNSTATIKMIKPGYYAITPGGFEGGTHAGGIFTINGKTVITLTVIAVVICWSLVALAIIKSNNPRLYKKIVGIFPKRSQIRNSIKRSAFVLHETHFKPKSKDTTSAESVEELDD